jgi:hypothetical protein
MRLRNLLQFSVPFRNYYKLYIDLEPRCSVSCIYELPAINCLSNRWCVESHCMQRSRVQHWSSTWGTLTPQGTQSHLRTYAKASYGLCKIEKIYFVRES